MKRLLFLAFISICIVPIWAQVGDAFKSVFPVTDKSLQKDLNGFWQLKVVNGITSDKSVPEADVTWKTVPVPGCWEGLQVGDGTEPKYNYPDSLTGYYRTSFTVPQEWRGQRVIIRFDGVLRGYDLWLNDQYVGTWESGYNTCLFDLTPYLTKKAFKGAPQRLAMRVYSHFKGYEFDCFDDWAAMGIFRDVTLFPVPETHLSDLTVTTKMDGEVTVKTSVANATVKTTPVSDGGVQVDFILTPDTTDVFRAELGLAYLLAPTIDRVQWMGYGPFASYPGRYQANRYVLWAKQKDDLYFEGNHAGIDAALFTDSLGNGVLVAGDSLNLNFEQTDRGIVVTVNAAVSGQGPKFAKTKFLGWKPGDGPVSASFRLYRIEANQWSEVISRLFTPAGDVPVPFRPFLTQYDTYLLRYQDIFEY